MTSRKDRISKIIDELSTDLLERDETVAVALLAALAGENVFLLGPPGTAKSLIARSIARAFATEKEEYFEYLMNKFSTPEEIFGPISIAELKNDNYIRKTEGFLPTAKFAFIDEIWKAGPAILNTLLTISNEKIFRNGIKNKKVPLKAIISASNETPAKGQGLEALYDRFIVRLYVSPLEATDSFHKLLNTAPIPAGKFVDQPIASEEWEKWQAEIHSVRISKETLKVIDLIRFEIDKKNKKEKATKIYVSDRRWQKAMTILKAAAYFCDRNETNLVDTLILRHCLWATENSRKQVVAIVEKAVLKSGFVTKNNYKNAKKEKDDIENEIDNIRYTKNTYKCDINIEGKKCFTFSCWVNHRGSHEKIISYIPKSKLGVSGEFHPYLEDGREIKNFLCDFNGTEKVSVRWANTSCAKDNISKNQNSGWCSCISISPPISEKKGEIKPAITSWMIDSYAKNTEELKKSLCDIKSEIVRQLNAFEREVETPFILKNIREIAEKGVRDQLQTIEDDMEECEKWKGRLVEAKKDLAN